MIGRGLEANDYDSGITGREGWARDGAAIYFGAIEVANADYATFKILNKHYAKDKSNVFNDESIIIGADPNSFVADTEVFAHDKDHKYVCGKAK